MLDRRRARQQPVLRQRNHRDRHAIALGDRHKAFAIRTALRSFGAAWRMQTNADPSARIKSPSRLTGASVGRSS
jgi:hypothetical protein